MIQRIRSYLILLLGAVATLTVVLAGGSASAQSMRSITVQLDWLPHPMHAPFHLARLNGWYKEAGLDVTFKDGSGSVVTVQVVGSGNFEIGHANLSSMAIGRGKGMPVRAIAGFMRKSDMGAIVPADSEIKSVKDLAGKKIVYTSGSLEAPFLDAFLAAGGLSRRDVQMLSVNASAKFSTYIAKSGDAVVTTVPFGTALLAKPRPSRGILFADHGLPLPGFGLFATEDMIEKEPEMLRTFVAATIKAWNYILDGHAEEGIDAIIKQKPGAKIDREMFLRGHKENTKFLTTEATKDKPFGWMAQDDWASTIKVMVESGVLPKDVKPEDFYTNKFIPEG